LQTAKAKTIWTIFVISIWLPRCINWLETPSAAKGQIKPKADWRVIDPPKKRTNEFEKQKSKKNPNSFVHSFLENLRRANLLTVLSDL
jgi:hypothetical protein